MERMTRPLILAASIAIGAGCDGSGDNAALAWAHDPEVVEWMAPGCLEAGHEAVVCGCTLHHMAEAMKSHGYLPFEVPKPTQGWPGEEDGALARWHTSCENWARVLGLVAPQVAAGPPS